MTTFPLSNELDYYKQERFQNSSKAFNRLMAELEGKQVQPLRISWVEGAVILKRGGEEINRIEKFVPVEIKKSFKDRGHHTGVYPWEQYIYKYFGVTEGGEIGFQKDRMTYFKKVLGGNPKTYVREFQACMFKAFIPEDLRDIVHKYCREGRKRRWLPKQVTLIPQKAETIRQMLKDGQENIIPFLMISDSNFSVSEFRKITGKSMWKRLLKNSPTRNHLICQAARKGYLTNSLREAMEIPSSVLKNPNKQVGWYPSESIEIMKKDKVLTKVDYHLKYVQTIKDTKRMYQQLEKEIPTQASKWDLNKWEEKHNWCVEQINLKKYSKDPFEWMTDLHKTFSSSFGFKAEILDNAYAIRVEGETMKHCVGSYNDRVREKDYLVVSIKDEQGRNYSTLGCWVGEEDENSVLRVSFNQHYMHCNQRVSDTRVKEFAQWVVKQVNNQLKGDTYETFYEESEDSLATSPKMG